MGCELCNNAKRENQDVSLSRQPNKPLIKKFESETTTNNNSIIDTYRAALEEKLNSKYSLPQKSELTIINSKENKNVFNYNQNIIHNNNIIKIDSRNKQIKQKENEVMNSILKEKNDFAYLEFNNNFNSKDNNNDVNNSKLKSESINLPEITNINNNNYINKKENKKEILNYKKQNKQIHISKKKKEEEEEEEEEEEDEENIKKSENIKKDKKEKEIKKEKDMKKEKEIKKENKREKEVKNSFKNNEEEDEDEDEENEEESEEKGNNDNNLEDNNKYKLEQIKENINSLLERINYSQIDKIINQSPEREDTTLTKLIKYFQTKSQKLSEVEKSWLIYKWITLNIEYDFAGVNDKKYDVSEEATFNRGKSICEGYANLFNKISTELNLIVEKIHGHSKGFNFELTDKFEESESHAWNAVKINGVWYFIETTWGAGYSEDHRNFIKKFTKYYFFTPPIQFIRGHFPEQSKWQLLPKNKIINQKKFMEFVDLKSMFFELGFEKIEPDITFNNVKEKGNAKIFFNEKNVNADKIKIMAKLELIQNKNNLKEIENSTIVIKNKNFFEVNYLINSKGKYKLQIFGAKIEEEKYSDLCSLILISKKDSSSYLTFPKTYKLYNNSDMEIISPKNGVLYNGDTINFEFKTSTYKELFIIISSPESGNNFINIERIGNAFKEKDILIYGQSVKISTKNPKSDVYDTLLEYTVQKNPNNNNVITYPKVYSGPKNKLVRPICNTLKKGQKVSFEIKSFFVTKMVVFDGDKSHELTKKNDSFSGNILIKGHKTNSVKIGYSKDGKTFGILYEYNVIS